MIATNRVGARLLFYKICELENCTVGTTAFFEALDDPKKIPLQSIDNSNFKLHESLNSRNGRNIYEAVQWTNLKLIRVIYFST